MACRIERELRSLCLTLGLCWVPPLFAQVGVQAPDDAETHVHAPDVEGAAPSLEFLEFLGQWETDDGEWIAPEELANEDFGQLLEAAFETGIEDSD